MSRKYTLTTMPRSETHSYNGTGTVHLFDGKEWVPAVTDPEYAHRVALVATSVGEPAPAIIRDPPPPPPHANDSPVSYAMSNGYQVA